ncbi:hypothetical protein CRYUN_Cryun32bG0109100 [Craigia yunnanensis]
MEKENKKVDSAALEGFSPVSTTRIFWNSRKRSASGRNLDQVTEETANMTPTKQEEETSDQENAPDSTTASELSDRRKALFEPLEPIKNVNGRRPSAESLLPPPDFDAASYPKGWLIGKKRKLVNVDVVESMRRIAVQEMNRKVYSLDLTYSKNTRTCTFTEDTWAREKLLHTSLILLARGLRNQDAIYMQA